jgi:uncharacterized membrane protein YdbT with pleckstrin-like domain
MASGPDLYAPDPDPDAAPGTDASGVRYDGGLTAGDPHDRHAVQAEPPQPPPRLVAQYLTAQEMKYGVIAVRQHWIVLVPAAAVVVLGLAAAIALNAWLYYRIPVSLAATRVMIHAEWIAYAIGVLWALLWYASWRVRWFVVTGTKLVGITGLLKRRVTPLPLKRVRDMELIQPALGHLLGYGTLECESIATDHALHTVTHVPFTLDVWDQIWRRLLPNVAAGVGIDNEMPEDPW